MSALTQATAHGKTLEKPSAAELIQRRGLRLNAGRLSLWVIASLVAGLVLLIPVYLLWRTIGSGQEALQTLTSLQTIRILGNTIVLVVAVTVGAAAIAVPLAWLLVCSDLPGKRLWTALAALSLALPSYVAAFVFVSLFSPKGLIQQFLYPLLGVERLPGITGFAGAFIVLTLISYPFVLLTVQAALRRQDPSLVEAARSLGLSRRHAFLRITLPGIRPAIMAGSLLVALYVLRDFGAVTLLQYNTFTRIIYNRYLSYRLDAAAAMALVLVLVAAVFLYLEIRSRGRARYGRLSAGAARKARPFILGRWKAPALLFVFSVIFASLILPATGLFYWFWRGWRQDWLVADLAGTQSNVQSLLHLLQPAWNSFSASFMAAVLTVLCALPIAIVVVRRPGRLSRMLERITYSGFALPGIVVALALVFFGVNYARPMYQTLPMLLAAYVILFLPQAVGAQRSSLVQVPPNLEEVGRALGKRPIQVFRRVTLPLVRPGVVAAGAMVFLTCMKELPATLILSPLGFQTLATQVWSNIGEAFFARAALPTLVLLLLSTLPLAFLTIRDKNE